MEIKVPSERTILLPTVQANLPGIWEFEIRFYQFSILDFRLRIEQFLPRKRFNVFICTLILKNRYSP